MNAAGQDQDVRWFSTWTLAGEEWVDAIDRRQGEDWRYRIGGLKAGTRGIASSARSYSWFEPQVVEVLLGETKSVTLLCEEWVDLTLVEGGTIEVFESRGVQQILVDRLQLSPGEQEWDIVLPPR